MYKNLLLLLLISILGCSKKGEAFIAVEEINETNEILIIPLRPLISELGDNDELLLPNPIRIKDPLTIERIINEWGKDKSGHPGFPYYKVLLLENDEIIRTVSLNKDLSGMFTGHGFYQFSKEELFNHELAFEQLSWVNIKIKSVEDTRLLMEALERESYIYTEFIYPKGNVVQNTSGELNVITSRLEDSKIEDMELDDFAQILQEELNDTSISVSRLNSISSDTVELTIRSETDISRSLPSNYRVSKEWKEFENIEVEILGIKPTQVRSIAKKLGINAEIK